MGSTPRGAAHWSLLARRSALVGGAVLALSTPAGATGSGAAPTPIQLCPYTIIAPGSYVLARDLACSGDGIVVAADKVRLFLNGRTLTGDGEGGDDGILAEGTNADSITGLRIVGPGTVTNFRLNGVFVRNAPGARIANVTATGNGDDGIDVADSPDTRIISNTATGNGDGFILAFADGYVVAGNRSVDNLRNGIRAVLTPGARFRNNTVSGSGEHGISVVGCVGCKIADNRVKGSGGQGILVEGDTTGARIAGNTTADNGGAGIDLSESTVYGNHVQGNAATGNGPVGSGWQQARQATGWRATGQGTTRLST